MNKVKNFLVGHPSLTKRQRIERMIQLGVVAILMCILVVGLLNIAIVDYTGKPNWLSRWVVSTGGSVLWGIATVLNMICAYVFFKIGCERTSRKNILKLNLLGQILEFIILICITANLTGWLSLFAAGGSKALPFVESAGIPMADGFLWKSVITGCGLKILGSLIPIAVYDRKLSTQKKIMFPWLAFFTLMMCTGIVLNIFFVSKLTGVTNQSTGYTYDTKAAVAIIQGMDGPRVIANSIDTTKYEDGLDMSRLKEKYPSPFFDEKVYRAAFEAVYFSATHDKVEEKDSFGKTFEVKDKHGNNVYKIKLNYSSFKFDAETLRLVDDNKIRETIFNHLLEPIPDDAPKDYDGLKKLQNGFAGAIKTFGPNETKNDFGIFNGEAAMSAIFFLWILMFLAETLVIIRDISVWFSPKIFKGARIAEKTLFAFPQSLIKGNLTGCVRVVADVGFLVTWFVSMYSKNPKIAYTPVEKYEMNTFISGDIDSQAKRLAFYQKNGYELPAESKNIFRLDGSPKAKEEVRQDKLLLATETLLPQLQAQVEQLKLENEEIKKLQLQAPVEKPKTTTKKK